MLRKIVDNRYKSRILLQMDRSFPIQLPNKFPSIPRQSSGLRASPFPLLAYVRMGQAPATPGETSKFQYKKNHANISQSSRKYLATSFNDIFCRSRPANLLTSLPVGWPTGEGQAGLSSRGHVRRQAIQPYLSFCARVSSLNKYPINVPYVP